MKEKIKDIKELYSKAMVLLEGCNDTLQQDEKLSTINTKLAGVVKDLNDIIIRDTTGIPFKAEEGK